MLKHWLEAQIQHNRNCESCLIHSWFALQPNKQLLPIPKWDLPPTICQLPDGYEKSAKVPLILGVIQTSPLWMKSNYEPNFYKWKVSIALHIFIWKRIKPSSFQHQCSVIMTFWDPTMKYFATFSSMLQGKIILNICTTVR